MRGGGVRALSDGNEWGEVGGGWKNEAEWVWRLEREGAEEGRR